MQGCVTVILSQIWGNPSFDQIADYIHVTFLGSQMQGRSAIRRSDPCGDFFPEN
jgi:hypothetical protein